MICDHVTANIYIDQVKLIAVCGGKNEEDNTYARATPCATIELQIDNPAARGSFVPGKTYYVDFTRVKEAPATPAS